MKYFIFALLLVMLNFKASSSEETEVQKKIREEYGSCYNLEEYLSSCIPFNCVKAYPYYNNAWHTSQIVGMKGDKCYMVSYAYIGQKLIGHPSHCLFSTNDIYTFSSLMKRLKRISHNYIEVRDIEKEISQFLNNICITKTIDKNDKK